MRTKNRSVLRKVSDWLIQNFSDELKQNDIYDILLKIKQLKGFQISTRDWGREGVYDIKYVLDVFDEAGIDYKKYILETPRQNALFTISGGYDSTRVKWRKTSVNSEGDPEYTKYDGKSIVNRYAGVNNHFKACVLGMGEYRTPINRVYFTDEASANRFLEDFNKKFGDRNFNFKVKKVDNRNPMLDSDILMKVPSDCGYCYQIVNL